MAQIFECLKDGSLLDKWGNNNGTLTAGTGGFKKSERGQAMQFDGSATYVDCGNSSDFNISRITVSFWAKRVNDTGGFEPIVSKWLGASNDREWLIGIDNVDEWYWQTSQDGVNSVNLSSGVTSTLNEWTYIVGTFDGSTMKIYVNSDEKNSTSQTSFLNGSADIEIGSSNAGSVDFDGSISKVRIFNYALTPTQIRQMYLMEGGRL